jgi:hypothetical protein
LSRSSLVAAWSRWAFARLSSKCRTSSAAAGWLAVTASPSSKMSRSIRPATLNDRFTYQTSVFPWRVRTTGPSAAVHLYRLVGDDSADQGEAAVDDLV